MCGSPESCPCHLKYNPDVLLRAEVTLPQKALRRQQAAMARRIAEGRSEGRSRRRLLRKERLAERMRKEREEQTTRRQMVKVILSPGSASVIPPTAAQAPHTHVTMLLEQTSGTTDDVEDPRRSWHHTNV